MLVCFKLFGYSIFWKITFPIFQKFRKFVFQLSNFMTYLNFSKFKHLVFWWKAHIVIYKIQLCQENQVCCLLTEKNDTSCKIGRLIFNNLEIVKLVAVQMNELNVYTVYVSNFCQFFTLTWKLDQQLNYPIYWVNAPNCDSSARIWNFSSLNSVKVSNLKRLWIRLEIPLETWNRHRFLSC